MTKMKKQSEFLKQQSEKAAIIYEKQKKFEQNMTLNQQQMRDVKIRLEELKDEDLKLMLNTKKEITFLNEEVSALKRQRQKYEDMINKQKKENDKILQNFNKYQLWMDSKVLSMNEDYLKLKKQTLQMTAHVKNDYESTKLKFKDLQKTIESKMLANDKKYQILELYLSERESTKLKMVQLEQRFSEYAPVQKIEYLRKCQIKELQMNKNEINTILDTYLPPQIKQMLPQIQKRVKQIDKMSVQISDIKTNVFQSEQEIVHFKESTQSLQSNFRKQFKQINHNLTSHIQVLKTDVRVALAIDQKQTQERKQFQKLFANQIQTFVQKQNQKTIKQMQQDTFSKLDERQKKQQGKLNQQQQNLDKKYAEMKDISENIQNLLTKYNSRIVKIRSDTELFKNQLMKEMKSIAKMKAQNGQKFQDIGKIIASLIEVLTMNLTIEMNADKNSLKNDNFAFATYNDGLIYQTVPLYGKQGKSNNSNHITYRRNQLEIPHFRRSILASITSLIDRVHQSYPYLLWQNYKPSNFFKEQVLQNYHIQFQKYGSLAQNHNDKMNIQSNSYNVLKKSDNSALLYTRNKGSQKSYSPPKKQNMTLTMTVDQEYKANDASFNNFHQLGETIDQNIEINVSRGQSGFLMNENDKTNIKRAMRTIHEVHPRDANNNRFVLSGLANRSSLTRDANKTIDHPPQSAGGNRKRYLAKSKKQPGQSRYNEAQTFMTSRSSRRTTSIGNYKF